MKLRKRYLGFLLLAIPYGDNPWRYVHAPDMIKAASLPVALIFGFPCTTKEYPLGNKIPATVFHSGPQCWRYDGPRRYNGIWINAFEGSAFYENYTTWPDVGAKETGWLSMSSPLESSWHLHRQQPMPDVWRISFIGRKTVVKGGYGHMGGAYYDITVDRIISASKVDPARYVPILNDWTAKVMSKERLQTAKYSAIPKR